MAYRSQDGNNGITTSNSFSVNARKRTRYLRCACEDITELLLRKGALAAGTNATPLSLRAGAIERLRVDEWNRVWT
jgi:hypothetical protein